MRWGILLMLPFSLLPELVPGEGPHLARGFGFLAPASLMAGAMGAFFLSRSAIQVGLLAVVLFGSIDFGMTMRKVSGPLANSPDQKAWYLSVARETAVELKKLAVEAPFSRVEPPDYSLDPVLRLLIWNEMMRGRITAAPVLPSPPRLLRIIRDPIRKGPVIFFLVSPKWPKERILASVSADALVRPGENMERAGNLSGAEAHYRAVIRLVPDLARAHARLGFVLLRSHRSAEGRRELTESVRLAVDDESVFAVLKSGKGK